MLEGLPELSGLNMYGNKVAEIIVPQNTGLLSKLETLNLGYNDLTYLPDKAGSAQGASNAQAHEKLSRENSDASL